MAQVVLHLLCECLPALQAQSPEFKSQSHKKKKRKKEKRETWKWKLLALSLYLFIFAVLGIEPVALYMLGKHSTTELMPSPLFL
jgi:hypothetical protein